MPIFDAVICEICGTLVKINKGQKCGSNVYRCMNCVQFTPNILPPVVYAASPRTPKWVEAIGIVSFDLELGQTLTHLYPPLPFSFQQETDLAFLCFPDANNTDYGQHLHHFIYPMDRGSFDSTRSSVVRSPPTNLGENVAGQKKKSRDSMKAWATYNEEYFCSSFYRQKRDPTIERGAQQKAVVLLSVYSFPKVFEGVLQSFCEDLLDCKDTEKMLCILFDDISRWPPPLPTRQYDGLTLHGKILPEFRTPHYTSERFGPRWSETGRSRDQRQLYLRARLLEALESPSPDVHFMQSRLDASISGPNALCGFSDALQSALHLPLSVQTWRSDDILAVIRLLRVGAEFFNINSHYIEEHDDGKNDGEKEKINEYSATAYSVAAHFRHINYLSADVACIQNSELNRWRNFARQFLQNVKWMTTEVDEDGSNELFADYDMHVILFPHLNRLWKLWELLITGESLCIVGGSVKRVTACCLCLYSLLAPLSLNGVVRPYVTINNSEVDCLQPNGNRRIPILSGATNPFFVRHWMNVPHFLSLGDKDCEELQTHKVLPDSSSKRPKLQFELKSNMFTSKHFLIKSEKNAWDNNKSDFSPTRLRDIFHIDGVTNTTLENLNISDSIRQTFFGITKQFLRPLERVLEHEFEKNSPLLYCYIDPPSNGVIFAALQNCASNDLPLHMFKQRQDMFNIYHDFMNTSTYISWLWKKIYASQRSAVLSAKSLEEIVLMDPNPESRYTIIMSLQYMLESEAKSALIDVTLLRKLLDLTGDIASLRYILSGYR